MRLRIGYYDDGKVKGGTTRYLFDLLQGLDRDEFEPIFFALTDYHWHEELRQLGVKVVTPNYGRPASLTPVRQESKPEEASNSKRIRLPQSLAWHLGLASELKNLYKLFNREPVDLFHSDNVGAEPAPIAAHWTGKPVIGTLHVDPTYDLFGERSSWRFRNLEKRCLRSLDYAIADSRSTGDLWSMRCDLSQDYRSTKMSVIYYGIDATRLVRRQTSQAARKNLNIPSDAFVVASLGRLEPAKGYEYLIRALPAIVQSVPSLEVVIGGQGFLKEELLKLAKSLGVLERLHFTGFLTDVRDILEAGDIYVQPSVCEALGYGLLEAQLMGLPAVISNIGGMPEIVEHGVRGLIVSPRDPDALATAVISLAKDPAARAKFGAEAQLHVKRTFPMEAMHKQTFELYRELIRSRQGRRFRAERADRRTRPEQCGPCE